MFEGLFNMFEFLCNDGREGKETTKSMSVISHKISSKNPPTVHLENSRNENATWKDFAAYIYISSDVKFFIVKHERKTHLYCCAVHK